MLILYLGNEKVSVLLFRLEDLLVDSCSLKMISISIMYPCFLSFSCPFSNSTDVIVDVQSHTEIQYK